MNESLQESILRFLTTFTVFVFAVLACYSDKPLNRFFTAPIYVSHKIDLAQMLKMLRQNDVTVVDLRTPSEFNRGRIGNAINIPFNLSLKDASLRLLNKPKERPVIVYHTAETSELYRGIALLQRIGFDKGIYIFLPGWSQWTATGLAGRSLAHKDSTQSK